MDAIVRESGHAKRTLSKQRTMRGQKATQWRADARW
jgi:hypothetical protein